RHRPATRTDAVRTAVHADGPRARSPRSLPDRRAGPLGRAVHRPSHGPRPPPPRRSAEAAGERGARNIALLRFGRTLISIRASSTAKGFEPKRNGTGIVGAGVRPGVRGIVFDRDDIGGP